VENKCTSHKPILRAIRVPKIIKVGENLTTFWRKQFCSFFGTRCNETFHARTRTCCAL